MQNQKTLSRLLTAALVSLASVAAVSVHAAPPADATTKPAVTGSATPAVPGATSAFADDAMITTKVKAALIEDKDVQSLKISVSTAKGVVLISGTVPSAAVAKRALKLAASVQGVKDVKSELKVEG